METQLLLSFVRFHLILPNYQNQVLNYHNPEYLG